VTEGESLPAMIAIGSPTQGQQLVDVRAEDVLGDRAGESRAAPVVQLPDQGWVAGRRAAHASVPPARRLGPAGRERHDIAASARAPE
jgi:hypothetical protein